MNNKLLAIKEPFLPPKCSPSRKIVAVASIAAGSQFCWALQFSLLTPYVQLLGIPHTWASLIWLCGPISGMVVQPIAGHHSDRSTSRFGRRTPFIAASAAAIALSVLLIGYAADIGHLCGDRIGRSPKPRATAVFVLGFWLLDAANNMLQGPCRALLADLSGSDQKLTSNANALFTFFLAVGSVLGYAAGSYSYLYKMLPFTKTKACGADCANLKTCFFIAIALLSTVTVIALTYVKEKQWSPVTRKADTKEISAALKNTDRPMWILLMLTCLATAAFFPSLLYNTDWIGREVYGGDSNGSVAQVELYSIGVRAGTVGLMIGAVVLGLTSLNVETMARRLGKMKILWGIGNIILAICYTFTLLITKLAELDRKYAAKNGVVSAVTLQPSGYIKAAAVTVIALMGFPQALLWSIPFALAAMFSYESRAGQGLSMGVVNLAIAISQLMVSLTSGPFDALFGGGNLPIFAVGAVIAIVSGISILKMLPSPPPDASIDDIVIGFH